MRGGLMSVSLRTRTREMCGRYGMGCDGREGEAIDTSKARSKAHSPIGSLDLHTK